MPRANWFFGFPVDGAFVLELPEVPRSFRRFHSEDIHLTLAFLGGCGEAGAQRALLALDAALAASPLQSVDISLGEVVPMGASRRSYSALSALLERGRVEAAANITALRDALTDAASNRRETRPAKPHVTLARPGGRATDADRSAGLNWASSLDLRAVQARLNRVALYTWNESRRERLFQIVAERHLD